MKTIKKFVPQFVKRIIIFLYVLSRLILKGRSGDKIRLNLAGVLPPPGKLVHGGKVKLLHLREYFNETWQNFNIAYFVSSGLPFAPDIWIRVYKLFGIKVVWNQNGFAYPALYPREVVDRVNGLFQSVHLCDYIVYQTEFTKRCTEKFIGEIQKPFSVLINPVDTDKFKPRTTPLEVTPWTILMLGNHFESKERMDTSIKALRILKEKGIDLKLIILGKCEQEFEEKWIEKRGPYLQEEAPALFQSAHIFLHLKYLDPCPTAVLEALSSGLPVVGSQSGGMPELVSINSGILIEVPEDFNQLYYPEAEAVAESIETIMRALPTYSSAARNEAVEQFDKKKWLKCHEEIFHKLCQKSL